MKVDRRDPWVSQFRAPSYEVDPGHFDMDPDRHDATCWPSLTEPRRINHGGPTYWRVECRNCHGTWRADTAAEATNAARAAHGDPPAGTTWEPF